MIKAILVGYPGSQKIVRASEHLIGKYVVDVSTEVFPIFLNHTGPVQEWAAALSNFFKLLPDELVIFALDDYLIAGKLDLQIYDQALKRMEEDRGVACVKLCHATPAENNAYPVTTQWTIWRRNHLINLLDRVRTPWEFEMIGSDYFKKYFAPSGLKSLHAPCLPYFTNSAISARWEGINVEGLCPEDKAQIINGL